MKTRFALLICVSSVLICGSGCQSAPAKPVHAGKASSPAHVHSLRDLVR